MRVPYQARVRLRKSILREGKRQTDGRRPMAFKEDRLCGVEVSGNLAVRTSTLLRCRHSLQSHETLQAASFIAIAIPLSHSYTLTFSFLATALELVALLYWPVDLFFLRRQCVCCSPFAGPLALRLFFAQRKIELK